MTKKLSDGQQKGFRWMDMLVKQNKLNKKNWILSLTLV